MGRRKRYHPWEKQVNEDKVESIQNHIRHPRYASLFESHRLWLLIDLESMHHEVNGDIIIQVIEILNVAMP